MQFTRKDPHLKNVQGQGKVGNGSPGRVLLQSCGRGEAGTGWRNMDVSFRNLLEVEAITRETGRAWRPRDRVVQSDPRSLGPLSWHTKAPLGLHLMGAYQTAFWSVRDTDFGLWILIIQFKYCFRIFKKLPEGKKRWSCRLTRKMSVLGWELRQTAVLLFQLI